MKWPFDSAEVHNRSQFKKGFCCLIASDSLNSCIKEKGKCGDIAKVQREPLAHLFPE